MICKDDISNIKTELNENIGRKIIIRGAMGRKKFFEEEAVIENTYPSYRYTDILTNELQISIFNGKEYFPLIPATLRTKF